MAQAERTGARRGAHMIARHPDKTRYLHRDDPDWPVHAEEISGEYRKVTMWNNDDRNGHGHRAVDYVPVEHLDEYVAVCYSNAHRDTQAGDRAWDNVVVGEEHDAGPGGDDQHWFDEHQVRAIHAARAARLSGKDA